MILLLVDLGHPQVLAAVSNATVNILLPRLCGHVLSYLWVSPQRGLTGS